MKHKSIMTTDGERCYLCGKYLPVEWHHIFGGANRKNSERYGLVVPLCHMCHNEPPDGVHFNEEKNIELKKEGQLKFESIESHERFMEIFGRNYL